MTSRFPVLVWADAAGNFTAQLVEKEDYGPPAAAYGVTAQEALLQLKDYLRWSYEKDTITAPDFQEAQLITFGVDVRPEYQREGRVYPCGETVRLRVPCVHGRQENGLFVAALPLLGLQFYYYEAKELRALVTNYVQEALKNLTPQELSRHLPPFLVLLTELTLPRTTRPPKAWVYEPQAETLKTIATALGSREMQRQFAKPYERETEVAALVSCLTNERANVLLVAEAGAGKSTVLAQAVRHIERQGERGEKEKEKDDAARRKPRQRFWLTNGARLIAGMKYLGQWEARCEELISELDAMDGVLCVENLLDLVQAGGASPNESIASFFLPYLQRGELRLVAEATPTELDACRRLLPNFAEAFQIVKLPTFTPEKAVAVLDALAAAQQREGNLSTAQGVTPLIYRLFQRFLPYQAFPGPAAGFLHELGAQAVREKRATITQRDVITAFGQRTGLPELFLRDEVLLAYDDVLATLESEIIGQTAACRVAAHLVATFKAGLNDPTRPVGVLLFCGPTGVGKTELAKALARYFFGHGARPDEARLVRLDMSEYSGYGAAERLLRNPDGTPSLLVQTLRQQPFAVVLLDEIEKADAAVFDVLLSVFDEGRLTDRYGRTTSFRSAIIIMTSNLGAEKFSGIGFGEPVPASAEREAMAFFRPEFFNRFDAVVGFRALAPESIHAITRKELASLAQREGLTKTGRRIVFSDALVAHLARAGYDPRYGARPLQRAIETLVTAPLARYLLTETAPPQLLTVSVDDAGAVFIK